MKKFYIILCLTIVSLTKLQAQAPQGFNYQATVRNNAGELIVNTNVYFKFNVIQGSQTAVPTYTETHYVPTDDLGQVNLTIGQGTANTGMFSEIDWSLGSYFLGIELDTGNGYVAMGTTQLLSVPYALYAENSGNASTTTPNLQSVLAENNSANSQQIKDLQDPTNAKDAVTKSYVETNFYSKSEVDALIADLQAQVDALDNSSGSIADQDGNIYNYRTYGDQLWTIENAKMVTYRDGTPIPQVANQTEWSNLTTGAWCYYNNDPTKPRLYNWYAIMGIHNEASLTDASQRKEFAPEGWHTPIDDEWIILRDYLIANGYNYDGTTTGNKIAKSMASKTGWTIQGADGGPGNDQSTNNSSRFNMIPVGEREDVFRKEGSETHFWTTRENNVNEAYHMCISTSYASLQWITNGTKQRGYSVRFVKD